MKGYLTHDHIEYVLYHLNFHIDITRSIRNQFVFVKNLNESTGVNNRIIFPLSERGPNLEDTEYVNEVPVLFPVSGSSEPFTIDDHGNLVFNFDILKSAFYLLSGYQEYENPKSKDRLGRYTYEDSLQCKLGMISKPIVNYYFEMIVQGLDVFGAKQNIVVTHRRLFPTFGFMLSHDIDSIDLYTRKFILYKVKEMLGIVKSRLSFLSNLKLFTRGLLIFLKLRKDSNPHWNFDLLRELEREHGFISVFYFLEKGVPNSDADYSFDEERLKTIFQFLKEEKCEIGLHGTVRSVDSSSAMIASLRRLEQAAGSKVTGVRQHRLLWKHPETALVQQEAGLTYDATLGFAAHEGFRNSYCYPYRLFDFQSGKMTDLWELSLNVMDVTLFAYRNYSTTEALKRCLDIIAEAERFGGVFSLLWHNSFFDETTYPGITNFYKEILSKIADHNPECLTGDAICQRIETEIR